MKVIEKVSVEEVLTENDRIKGVKTNHGQIDCQYFVNSSGQVMADAFNYEKYLLFNYCFKGYRLGNFE